MPEALPPWMNILQPFNGLVWLCLLATLLACFGFLYVLKRKTLLGKCDPFILVALLLRQNSGRKEEWSDGLRIFLYLFIFGCLVITVGYQGSLFSCLAVPAIPAPIGDISQQIFPMKSMK